MSSPKTVTTTPMTIVPVNWKRHNIVLQNNGKNDVYLTKNIPGTADRIPSPTSYDFVLRAAKGESSIGEVLILRTISKFIGVTEKQDSLVGVMETIKMEVSSE